MTHYKMNAGHPRIIHRDIKSANILIDNNFEAMVISINCCLDIYAFKLINLIYIFILLLIYSNES